MHTFHAMDSLTILIQCGHTYTRRIMNLVPTNGWRVTTTTLLFDLAVCLTLFPCSSTSTALVEDLDCFVTKNKEEEEAVTAHHGMIVVGSVVTRHPTMHIWYCVNFLRLQVLLAKMSRSLPKLSSRTKAAFGRTRCVLIMVTTWWWWRWDVLY